MSNREKVIVLEAINTKIHKPTFEIIYNSALKKVKEKVSAISIRPSTLHLIIKYVIEEVEETPTKGAEQKEMALKIIRTLIVDLTEGADEEVLIKLLDDNTISNLIDLIIDATKGKLNINKIASVSSGCINSCIPYLCPSRKIKK